MAFSTDVLLARSRSRDASPALEHEHKLPPGSVETAALRQEQAPAPLSVSWLRVVQQTQRVLAHDGIPAIELTIWRSRWPRRSPRRSSSCGGRGTIPFDGTQSRSASRARDRIARKGITRRRRPRRSLCYLAPAPIARLQRRRSARPDRAGSALRRTTGFAQEQERDADAGFEQSQQPASRRGPDCRSAAVAEADASGR